METLAKTSHDLKSVHAGGERAGRENTGRLPERAA
jgi:hypothetical protein